MQTNVGGEIVEDDGGVDCLSVQTQYAFLTSVLADRLNRAVDGFKLFLQLFSAIVGGAFWLSTQQKFEPGSAEAYVLLSNVLVLLVVLVTGLMVIQALVGWWGYRQALVRLSESVSGLNVPPPKARSLLGEGSMLLCMIIASGAFAFNNPFTKADASGGAGRVAISCRLAAMPGLGESKNDEFTMIYLLDPQLGKVVIGTMPRAPQGALVTTPYEYRMNFAGDGRLHAGRAVVNRFDGRMAREFGDPPFSEDGLIVKAGNIFQSWKCQRAPTRPIF